MQQDWRTSPEMNPRNFFAELKRRNVYNLAVPRFFRATRRRPAKG